jgi:hypothetical protein
MVWYNKGGNLDDPKLDEYVKVINLLKSAFETVFSDIHCLVYDYTTNSCDVQFGPFFFYNYWETAEYGNLYNEIVKRKDYNANKDDPSKIAASELKVKYSDKRKFKIMPFVTIGIYQYTNIKKELKELKNSVKIFDNEHKLYNKLFPSYIKPILVVLASLIVGYTTYILTNPEYNQNAGSKKRFSGGNSIQDLIATIDRKGLTKDQNIALNQITTVKELQNFIDTNLKELSEEDKNKIKKELENKLTSEQKKKFKEDFPGFDLKDDETVFGFLQKKMDAGKPLTKRHRKKRQNKKRKSRKSKK